ncbi:MAG: cytochrome c oxidase subunit II [Bacteroidota bacterium]|nr:cytochrome c oxidase subunit II [Bacteroidota bacterium]
MNSLVIGISVVLLLAIFFMLFRVQSLISVLKGSYNKKGGTSNQINAILFPIFFIVFCSLVIWYSGKATEHYLPKSASAQGILTDNLFWLVTGVILFAFVATNILLFSFPYTYQYKENRKAYFFPDNHKLEIIWTIIPAIVLSVLVFFGWRLWTDIQSPAPKNAVVLEITGKQFNWIVRYPGKDGKLGAYNFRLIDATNEVGIDFTDKASFDDFLPREIHIPKGTPVQFKIRARDVLHSVFLPHFRQKMDAVPGMPTTLWFTPIYTTDEMKSITGNPSFKYELACTEVCGRGHFGMKFIVVVDEPEDFEKWYGSQEPFIKQNPDYLANLPVTTKELAIK